LNGVVTNIYPGSEFSVQGAEVGTRKGYRTGAGIREALGEGLVEVVAHFSLEFNFPEGLKADASADTAEIIVCLR
jgi:hypothetical protein